MNNFSFRSKYFQQSSAANASVWHCRIAISHLFKVQGKRDLTVFQKLQTELSEAQQLALCLDDQIQGNVQQTKALHQATDR